LGTTATQSTEIFFRNIERARDIAQSVKSYLKQLNAFKERRLGTSWLITIGLSGAGFAFVSGVLLPIFNKNVPKLFLLWVPSAFYILVFIYILMEIGKA
jgi:hypothetical protein